MAMHDDDFDDLVAGLRDVATYQKGKRDGFAVHAPTEVDVRAIRRAQGLTQQNFAATYGFSTSAVRDWEQGRRQPERAARLLLAMIAHEPKTVARVMRAM